MKETVLAMSFLFLLISLTNVDGRSWSESRHSNKEKFSAHLGLFEEIGMLSMEACKILPSELKSKCLDTSEAYVHRTTLALRGQVDEEILCNRTGLCFMKSVTDERTCATCRRSVRDLFYQLKQSRIRMRVMDALLEYCEEIEDQEEQCKETVYKFAPLVLGQLEKLKTSDVCRIIGFCDEGISI
ncbi:uncharacterized protein LOC110020306 [Phalaenopsis equestris]|uniref:uncharacterized protein LOC110020306 n=1 Tax=Phalaenopsis equestris TaxID=78828 RepID=UPI0009E4BC74|nr:uncharacterized protein LOC110020306 [Phalaenopsis equestris]XP_020574018.1 uncharacterized protein LOC110020306 [Phalaenopsis equestris]